MYRFWDALTVPLLDALEPSSVLEIGSDHGFQTRPLLEYAQVRGITVHVVDPLPKYEVGAWQEEFGETLVMHQELSLNALPKIGHVDVALIDGDHNWYTAINELRLLERNAERVGSPLPLVLLHDVGWPYGRRDLYYDPETIPAAYRHPHRRAGIVPGEAGLVDDGGLNAHLHNAIHEDTIRNGVRTAVEDHIEESERDLLFDAIPGINGLGILRDRELVARTPRLTALIDDLRASGRAGDVMEAVERDRIKIQIDGEDRRRRLENRIEGLEDARRELERARDQEEQRRIRSERHAQELDERLEELKREVTAVRSELAAEGEARRQAERERDTAERARSRSAQRVEALRGEVSGVREALQRRDEELQRRDEELRRARSEYEAARALVTKREREYDRLLGRRAVRIALALASIFRPIFTVVRRMKKARKDGAQADGSGSEHADTSTGTSSDDGPVEPGVEDRSSPIDQHVLDALGRRPDVTVIVPVFNAPAELARCLESVARNTTYPADLLLIDDASTDPGVQEILARWETQDGVTVLRNEENLGFTRTVNRGFDATAGDVVLLNSDTQVPPRWLENLMAAAHASARLGTATAVSDNAGAFSVPAIDEPAALPAGWNVDDLGRLFLHGAERALPETPTANGFCAYIKRELLSDVGGFDEEAFPRGYGEENDLSMRALRAGWCHVVDDSTFVLHARQASFGDEKPQLAARGREVLDRRYPDYTERVRDFVTSADMETVRRRARQLLRGATASAPRPRPRVLFVVHEGTGGTPAIVRDHVRAIENDWEPFVLLSNTKHLKFGRYGDGGWQTIQQHDLDVPLRFTEGSNPEYRRFVTFLFATYGFELVHLRHLIKHTFDVPDVAGALNIPIVLSFHDHYFVCPTVHLLDEQDRFCGGVCTPGQGNCRIPMDWVSTDAPHLKHGWVHTWRERVNTMLEHVDAAVTTSPSVRDVHATTFPRLRDIPFHVVPHGRDLEQHPSLATAPSVHEPTRVLVVGNLDVHKGAKTLERLRRLDRGEVVELHFLGRVEDEFAELGTVHGRFDREELPQRVAEVRPSFIAIPSITAESYNHVLTEAWALGVPVIGSDMGAVGERIRSHGGGWTVDPRDASAVLALIHRLREDPEEYESARASATIEGLPRLADMAVEYNELYREVMEAHRALGVREEALRVDFLVHGEDGRHPGSVHVRTLARLRHPDIRSAVHAYSTTVSSILHDQARSEPEIVLVQRDAVPHTAVPATLEAIKRRDVRLIVDLDDDLVSGHTPEGSDMDVGAAAEGVRKLCQQADLVTVSTERLAHLVGDGARRVAVVPNHLDESLWFAPLDIDAERRAPDGSLRLLYAGSWTHARDLELLRAPLEMMRSEGVRVELSVVGGTSRDEGWFNRIEVPSGCTNYRRFVPWLRSVAPGFDVAVAPLVDDQFNAAKSDLKFLEYTGMGLPTVASRVAAYSSTIDHAVTGLVAGTTEEWVEALQLLRDPAERDRLYRNARSYVVEQRTLETHIDHYVELLRSVSEVSATQRSIRAT